MCSAIEGAVVCCKYSVNSVQMHFTVKCQKIININCVCKLVHCAFISSTLKLCGQNHMFTFAGIKMTPELQH